VRDLDRLLRKDNRPAKIRFCYTAEVTELAREEILAQVKSRTPRSRAEVVGLTQLRSSIALFPETFEGAFSTELDAMRRYADVRRAVADEAAGMRLALGTQLTADANELRQSILKGFVFESLAHRTAATRQEMLGDIGRQLSLLAPIHETYLTAALNALKASDCIAEDTGSYRLLPDGEKELVARGELACRTILRGCAAVREDTRARPRPIAIEQGVWPDLEGDRRWTCSAFLEERT
jgi:hypothetical protein